MPVEFYLGGLDTLAAKVTADPPKTMHEVADMMRSFHAREIVALGDVLEAKSVTHLEEARILSVLLGARLIQSYFNLRERLPADEPPDPRAFVLSVIFTTRAEMEAMTFDKFGKPGVPKH